MLCVHGTIPVKLQSSAQGAMINPMLQVDKAQEGTGDNHAISALKFKIIQEFLELGWNVLLSDVDVVIVQVSSHAACVCALSLWSCFGSQSCYSTAMRYDEESNKSLLLMHLTLKDEEATDVALQFAGVADTWAARSKNPVRKM